MKSLNNYINESFYDSSNLEDLKKQLLKMNAGDRIHAVWGVRKEYTNGTQKEKAPEQGLSLQTGMRE